MIWGHLPKGRKLHNEYGPSWGADPSFLGQGQGWGQGGDRGGVVYFGLRFVGARSRIGVGGSTGGNVRVSLGFI